MRKSAVENLQRATRSLGAAIIIQAIDDMTRKISGTIYTKKYAIERRREAKAFLKGELLPIYERFFDITLDKDYLKSTTAKDNRRYRDIIQRFQYNEDKEGRCMLKARTEQGYYKKGEENNERNQADLA